MTNNKLGGTRLSNQLPVIILDNVIEQIADIFTGSELVNLTNDFAMSVGEKVTYQSVGYNSKKKLLTQNIHDLSYSSQILFFKQLMQHNKIKSNNDLIEQINLLIQKGDLEKNKSQNSILNILKKYKCKEMEKSWIKLIERYNNDDYRNALDLVRLTLELLFRKVLNNEKSLENQNKALGNFFKNKGVDIYTINTVEKILKSYTTFQNNKVKHKYPLNLSKSEVSFFMNLTVILIRFIDEINSKS